MKNLKLGIGDRIRVYKANMIIPQILENITASDTITPPAVCPVCNGKTEIHDEDGIQTLYCTNPECMAKKIKLLTHFVSRDAMNIAGLSEMSLEKFTDEGFIHELADVFRLSKHKKEIVSLEGFGLKSYENLIAATDKARETTAVRVLYSMGIPEIGLAAAKLICRYFNDDMTAIENATPDELVKIDGIGDIMAETYTLFFKNLAHRQTYEDVLSEVRVAAPSYSGENEGEGKLSGLTFVITGDVKKFKNRKELQNFIEEHGGKATGTVTGKTSYLINNDVNSSSNKNKKAKELGVPIISEEDFMNLMR